MKSSVGRFDGRSRMRLRGDTQRVRRLKAVATVVFLVLLPLTIDLASQVSRAFGFDMQVVSAIGGAVSRSVATDFDVDGGKLAVDESGSGGSDGAWDVADDRGSGSFGTDAATGIIDAAFSDSATRVSELSSGESSRIATLPAGLAGNLGLPAYAGSFLLHGTGEVIEYECSLDPDEAMEDLRIAMESRDWRAIAMGELCGCSFSRTGAAAEGEPCWVVAYAVKAAGKTSVVLQLDLQD
jgi:hypothetical protein